MNTKPPGPNTSTNSQAHELFTEITRREYTTAATEIKTHGWKPALLASQKRQDHLARIIASNASPAIACKSGCWYCCHYKVDARAEEILQITDYVNTRFSAERKSKLQQDVASNAQILRSLSAEEQLQANLKCAFLDDGTCSIYEVRPARCKLFHATDVAGCKKSYEEPANLNIPNTSVPELFYAGEAHLKGVRQAFMDADFDTTVYELNSALHIALADSTPKRRFEKYKKAFVGIGKTL